MKVFEEEREKMKLQEEKMAEMKSSHWKEGTELEEGFNAELTQLMEKLKLQFRLQKYLNWCKYLEWRMLFVALNALNRKFHGNILACHAQYHVVSFMGLTPLDGIKVVLK
nr:protein suppressor of gene silencing 3 [Tanacetum cinerariifolium]